MGRSRSRSKSASKKKSKKDKRSKKSKKYTRSRSRSKSYRSYSNSPRRYKNRDRDRERSRDEDYYRSKNEPSQWLYIQDIQDDLTQEIIENAFQDVSIQAGTSLPDEVRMVVFFKQVFIQYPSVASASKVLYHQKGKIQINGFTYNMDFYVNEQQKQAQLTIPAYLDSTQDWMCEKCDYKNFAKRTRCHKCDRPKSQVCKALITPAQIKPQVIENVQNTSLMVRGNVITQVTETQLLDIFQKYSQVKDIRLVKNKTTGAQRDFAFVEFFTVEEAEKVLEQTERDLRINGQDVHVLYSKSKNETSGGSSSASYSTQQQQQLQYYNYIQQQQQPQIENIQNPDAAYYQQTAAYYQNYQGQQGQQSQYQQQIYQTNMPIDPNNPQIQQYNQQILHPQMPQQQVPLPPQPPQPQQQPSQDSYQSAYMSIQEDQESLRKKEEQKKKDEEILQKKKLEAENMLQKKLKQEKELQEKLRRQQEDPLIKKQREEEELRKKEEEKKKQQEKEQKEKELQEKINRQKKAEQELKKWEKRQKFQAMAPDSPQQDQQQNQDQLQMQQNDDQNQVQSQIKNQQQQKSDDDNKAFLIICSICKKKFKSQEILRQHDKYSESHKKFLKQIEVGV